MRSLVAAFSVLLGACATLSSDASVCPEYRDVRCATAPECSVDRDRGCRVCQCSAAGAEDGRELPTAVPPDERP